MNLEVTSETERLVREEISNGHFQSVDDLIVSSVRAWREKNLSLVKPPKQAKSLVEFFRESPLVGLELEFEREKDMGRDIML